MDERQLIDRCIRGEAGAWEVLVREYGPSIHDAARFTLRRVLGSAQDEDIENIYQGVLLGLCDRDSHRLKLFQNRSSFRTWVTSVTVRFSLNYIRTEKRKGSLKYLALDASAQELPDRDLAPENAEDRERIHLNLEKIPRAARIGAFPARWRVLCHTSRMGKIRRGEITIHIDRVRVKAPLESISVGVGDDGESQHVCRTDMPDSVAALRSDWS